MPDEQKQNRINIEDLPQAEQELTTEEAKDVKGGIIIANTEGDLVKTNTSTSGIRVSGGDIDGDTGVNVLGTGAGGGPHVKGS
jgi:hypothetical protein